MARYMGRVIVMPNLVPPVTTVRLAAEYRQRILRAHAGRTTAVRAPDDPVPHGQHRRGDIREAAETSWLARVKLYPAGATTNSDAGVNSLEALYPVLEIMEEVDLPLLVHGEVTDATSTSSIARPSFIERTWRPSSSASRAARGAGAHHHLRRRGFRARRGSAGGRDDHGAPPAPEPQRHAGRRHSPTLLLPADPEAPEHQEALRAAAVSGDPGSSSAPTRRPTNWQHKESACGCAGIYSAHAALEFYAEVFEELGALDRLEDFAARFGADFYGLPREPGHASPCAASPGRCRQRCPWAPAALVPLRAGESLRWQVVDADAGPLHG
jgi:dihydroorotase